MMVEIEFSSRKSNQLKRLIRKDEFEQPELVSVISINYTSRRKLNKALIQRLTTCGYISEHCNLFITGVTSSGNLHESSLWYGSLQAAFQYKIYSTS